MSKKNNYHEIKYILNIKLISKLSLSASKKCYDKSNTVNGSLTMYGIYLYVQCK